MSEVPTPVNHEAERAVLAAVLARPDAMAELEGRLSAQDFSQRPLALTYRAVERLVAEGKHPDELTLSEFLERHKRLDEVGGREFLRSLGGSAADVRLLPQHAAIVREKSLLRQIISTSARLMQDAQQESKTALDLLDEAERRLLSLTRASSTGGYLASDELVASTLANIEAWLERRGDPMGVGSGFADIDRMLGGFQPGQLYLIAARPSMGKSSLMLNFAAHAAVHERRKVLIHSLEMDATSLMQRMLASAAQVDMQAVRNGHASPVVLERLKPHAESFARSNVLVDDTSTLTMPLLRSQARREASRGPLGMVMIDYLQLMTTDGREENRAIEVGKLSRDLKLLARELKVPVVVLSQLNRGVEARKDKRPMLSDLRDSGCLTGDSLVSLADGSVVPIRRVTVGARARTMDVASSRMGSAMVTAAFSTGFKPVFRLILAGGRMLRLTANHPLLTRAGWRRLDQLAPGMEVAIDQRGRADWARVASIDALGVEQVYDLTVPGPHNFVANGIVVHNSLEQDADVVMFVYREGYYQPDCPEPGVGEVIIAKQRNGPTGTVKVQWIEALASYRPLPRPSGAA